MLLHRMHPFGLFYVCSTVIPIRIKRDALLAVHSPTRPVWQLLINEWAQ
jgi:hypothetical protein